MNWDSFLFNASAFVAGLWLFGYGADAYIDNSAIVARRIAVSETLIALLTAGAEWEETFPWTRKCYRILNLLGAFSLGLLFHPGPATFDQSAKIYISILFLITTAFTIITFMDQLDRAADIFFIAVFMVYTLSITYGIYKGVLVVAEDDPSDDGSNAGDEVARAASITEMSSLIRNGRIEVNDYKPKRSLLFHVIQQLFGFIALSLSGYVLSHTASSLASVMNLADTIIGVTILSFATTLPEKFLSVLSGIRGHGGLVVRLRLETISSF